MDPSNPGLVPAGGALALAAAMLPALAVAANVEGSVQAVSDYVFRGVSQSAGQAALQGGVQYRSDADVYAGVWTSTLRPRDARAAHVEYDLYLGRAWRPVPNVETRLAVIRYGFGHEARDRDYAEALLSVSVRERWTFTAGWSPDTPRYLGWGTVRRRPTGTLEIATTQPLGARVAAFGSVGWQDLRALAGGTYWSYGGGLAWRTGAWSVTAARYGTSDFAKVAYGAEAAGPRWAASVAWQFGR